MIPYGRCLLRPYTTHKNLDIFLFLRYFPAIMYAKNLLETFQHTIKKRPQAIAMRFKENGEWKPLTWQEVATKVEALTDGLAGLGVQKGDRVCLFSKSCYQWTLSDLAILGTGAITVPIYESNTTDQAQFILENSEAKVVIIEKDQAEKIKKIRSSLKNLKHVIVFGKNAKKLKNDEFVLWEDVIKNGEKESRKVFEKMSHELGPDDEASYVYTSGTTGNPKGAVITHGNFLCELDALLKMIDLRESDESLLFLPLAHILARAVQFAQIQVGFVQCYAESIDKLMDNISEVKPHVMASVPRIFEKVHGRVMQTLEQGSTLKKQIFNWALQVGKMRAEYTLHNEPVPLLIKAQWPLAYQLVFSKLHEKMGGRVRFFLSGGAPLSKEIADFFHAAGFLILEGYGLTETSAAITCNSKKYNRVGTVGKVVPGVEIKIAPDGEILVKGGVVFKGYFKNPDATSEAIDSKGWFHTGDIGEFDKDGFLKITDRKKDIIVTAAGKNIAPQNIENLIKTDPFISQIIVHGDKRKFLSALVTLNQEEVVIYAKSKKIPFETYEQLVTHEKIQVLVRERIESKNKQLAKYESIKKFAILSQEFSVETGELTPTMKVKRKFTSEKYKEILDEFYRE